MFAYKYLYNNDVVNQPQPPDAAYGVVLEGTSSDYATEPKLLIGVTQPYNPSPFDLPSLYSFGSLANPAYGFIGVEPYSGDTLVVSDMHVNYGNVTIADMAGGGASFAINGNNWIWNNSYVLVSGGRYRGDPTTINGAVDVRSNSVLDLHATVAQGPGLVFASDGGIVSLGHVLAGLHAIAYDGGGLILQYGGKSGIAGGFAGDIAITSGGVIAAFGDSAATKEIFHTATGAMDLLNSAGALVDEYHFFGGAMPRVFQGAGSVTYMTGTALPGALPLVMRQ